MAEARYRTLREFWPFYLREHSRRGTRALHIVGSLGVIGWIAAAILLREPWFLLGAIVNGYGFAWIGHYFVEHNRPATFVYPWKSFVSDWIMLGCFLTGRLGKELQRHGVRPNS